MTEARNDLTAEDIAMLRDAETVLRAKIGTDRSDPTTIPPMLAASLTAGEVPARRPNYCTGCAMPLAGAIHWCDPCGKAAKAEARGLFLRDAYASLDPEGVLAWCRPGEDAFLAATRPAVAIAGRIQNPATRTRALRFLEGRWKRDMGSVLVLGPTRVGKTKSMVANGHRILDLAKSGGLDTDGWKLATGLRFMVGLRLAHARAEHKMGAGEPPLFAAAKRATLLMLDEIGHEADKTTVRDVIFDRAESRITLATSGLTMSAFQTAYGEATVARLIERGTLIDLHARTA